MTANRQNSDMQQWGQIAQAAGTFWQNLFTHFVLMPWNGWTSAISMPENSSSFIKTSSLPENMFPWSQPSAPTRTATAGGKAILSLPYCTLLHLDQSKENTQHGEIPAKQLPRLLVVTPYWGHSTVFFKDTLTSLQADHDVYVTDWHDAKNVPALHGSFTFEDSISYLLSFLKNLGNDLHVMSIGHSGPSALAAISLLAQQSEQTPRSLTLIGCPIDTHVSLCALSEAATTTSQDKFEGNNIAIVSLPYFGAGQTVRRGVQQLAPSPLSSSSPTKDEMKKSFENLVRGIDEVGEKRDELFNAYRACASDIPSAYYLQMIDLIYRANALANHNLSWNKIKVDTRSIQNTALLVIEGDLDDMTPPGQTSAALALCAGLGNDMKTSYLQIGVGHYGLFSGRQWRENIMPAMRSFIRTHNHAVDHNNGIQVPLQLAC